MRAIKKIDGVWHCFVCGAIAPNQARPHLGNCVCEQPPKLGLGDMISAGLAAVGITPERVSKVLGRPCGCKERAAKLTEWGRKFGIG